jgi:thiosulfate/3-mercaptopyruvate sulfurtransferase
VHFIDDLSDPDNPLLFMLAAPEHVGAVLSRFGATENTTIVVYGEARETAVHRVWWILSASGHRDVRVLDGGIRRWCAESRALVSGPASFEKTDYLPRPQTGRVATRIDAENAMNDQQDCLINALSVELFRGEGDQVFGRPGRIPGSYNVPSESLIDEKTGCFHSKERLSEIFENRLPPKCRRLIPYCGGGVAASTVALALAIIGREEVALYDGSLFDWAQDPGAPMATGGL